MAPESNDTPKSGGSGKAVPVLLAINSLLLAGVLLVEAAKQIYAKPAAARLPRRRLVYAPGAAPIRPGAVSAGHNAASDCNIFSELR